MSRLPGALGGPLSGPPGVVDLRTRRQAQKTSQGTGDYLGAGLTLDKQGRMAVKKIPLVDPTDPNALLYLIQHLQALGLMER